MAEHNRTYWYSTDTNSQMYVVRGRPTRVGPAGCARSKEEAKALLDGFLVELGMVEWRPAVDLLDVTAAERFRMATMRIPREAQRFVRASDSAAKANGIIFKLMVQSR